MTAVLVVRAANLEHAHLIFTSESSHQHISDSQNKSLSAEFAAAAVRGEMNYARGSRIKLESCG